MINDNMSEVQPSSIMPHKETKKSVSREQLSKDTNDLWRQTGIEYYNAYCTGVELGSKYKTSELKYSFITGIIQAIFEQIKTQIDSEDDLAERQRKQIIASKLHDGMVNQIHILRELNISVDELEIPPILHGYITSQIVNKNYDNKNEY